MIDIVFAVSVLLTLASWIMVPCVMEKSRKMGFRFYLPMAFLFSVFTIAWALIYGIHP